LMLIVIRRKYLLDQLIANLVVKVSFVLAASPAGSVSI
jgi:hypothetical protein